MPQHDSVSMTPEEWSRIEALFHDAFERPDANRAAFLDGACAGDSAMRRQVESLIQHAVQRQAPLTPQFLKDVGATFSVEELMAGCMIGHYEILSVVGAGGMGKVYRARDTKLGRDVAVKVLRQEFSRDNERVRRSEREAKLLASLNHPNIAAIYDLEESDGLLCLVLEFVEGQTLAERLKRGRLPMKEVLEIGHQIAEALESAHEKGIIHRDLKPGNVMITPSGEVKVLDFGLAKVRQAEGHVASLSDSPMIITAAGPGMILGTAAYMSPEQTKGNDADRTADVWAFGCVLYEMLTGRAVFQGETVGEIFAAVLETEPDWRRLPVETPEGIRRLLRRCLQKHSNLRFRDSGDVRIEIEEVQNGSDRDTRDYPQHRAPLAWITLTLASLLLAAAIVWIWRPAPSVSPAPEMRLEIVTPPTADPVSLAISPDGQNVAFVATAEGQSRLWLRSLDSVSASARPLMGTDRAESPFWKPDSRSIGFFADGKLKRIDIDGGTIQTLANSAAARGGTWNRDGVILFSPSSVGPIFRISETDGDPVPVTRLEPHQQAHHFPLFLPDGQHFIYGAGGSPEANGVYVARLDGKETRRLLDADSRTEYAAFGQLLFVKQGTLFAQDFDPVHLKLSGNRFSVAEHVASSFSSAFSASAAGPIAYRTGSAAPSRQFVRFDRSGNEIEKIGKPDSGRPVNPAISPKGHYVALNRIEDNNNDIYLLETKRGVLQQFTINPAIESNPIWSPDGNRILFNSSRNGPGALDLYEQSANSAPGNEQLILRTSQAKLATDWSRDGRFVLYQSVDPRSRNDIWVLPMDGNGKPGTQRPVIHGDADERDGQFSPNGEWIAYESDESGQFQIYVKPFSDLAAKPELISTTGGAQPRWSSDGKELFYIALDGQLMAVKIGLAPGTQTLKVEPPMALFPAHVDRVLPTAGTRQQYVVYPDRNFLMNTVAEEATSPITVIINWKPKP
jgi:Tol biopolymer transport system component